MVWNVPATFAAELGRHRASGPAKIDGAESTQVIVISRQIVSIAMTAEAIGGEERYQSRKVAPPRGFADQ